VYVSISLSIITLSYSDTDESYVESLITSSDVYIPINLLNLKRFDFDTLKQGRILLTFSVVSFILDYDKLPYY
jgi:hypothetical protein